MHGIHQWLAESGETVTKVLDGRSNVFLLTNGIRHILVDTATPSSRPALVRALERLGIDHIDALFLTHAHFDHAGSAHFVRERYGAKIITNERETASLLAGFTPMPRGTNLVAQVISSLGNLTRNKAMYEGCETDIAVNGRFDLHEFGFDACLLPTPGHTAGSMNLIVHDEIAISGDSLFGIFPGSVYPPFSDDERTMVESWGHMLETNCRVFLPSHGTAVLRETLQKEYDRYK